MNVKLLLPLLLFSAMAMAADQNVVAIYLQDGEVTQFAFADKPELSYSTTELIISTDDATVRYPINQLKKVSFELTNRPTAVITVPDDASKIFSFREGQIVIEGGVPNSVVNIYTVQGVLEMQYRLDGNGNAVIPTSSLRRFAVYILQNGSVTFKFAKP